MFKEALLSKSLRLAFGGSVAFLTLAGSSAFAQTATDSTTQTIERVEITGSNLKRTDTETPSPVQVLTIEDIKKSGYTDVSDVLRNISANGQGTLSQAFSGAFAAGASGIALRGLTVGATLVLIDGHRMAPYALSDDGERSFTDISQIPLEAIERIEILKDGASSIYGSDAIAGVVNIILKKSYVGTEVTVDYGMTSRYDGRTQHTAFITGMGDLDTDGHNVYLSLEYRHQDPIYVSNRPGQLTNLNLAPQGGVNLTPGVPNSLNEGFPGSVTGYLVDPKTGAITDYFPGCNATAQAAGNCAYDLGHPGPEIQPATQNIDALVSYTQRLWGDWQFAVKASIFDTHAEQVNGYASTSYLSGGPAIIAFSPSVKPTLIAPPTYITVPATYPGNTTGTTQNLVYNFANLGNVTTRADSQEYRLVGDLTGSAWGLDLALSAGFTESVVDQQFLGTYNIENLQAALNNPVTPYRVGAAAYLNTAAQNAFVSPPTAQRATDILEFVSAQASRDVFQLPGGPASVGVGLDFFHRELDSEAAPGAASGVEYPTNNAFAVGNQNVSAAYVEGAFPILKMLEIDASARVDDYQGTGSSTNPKVGFKFDPIPQVTFRGTYSTGFRAPNPAEQGNSGEAFFFTNLPDPILCPNPGKNQATTPGNYPTQCNVGLLGLQTPGTDLQPEQSRTYTLGVILEPLKQFNLSIDYYDIKITHQIISAESDPTYDPFNYIVRGNPIVAPYVNAAGVTVNQLTPVGTIVYAPFPYENAAFTTTNGVDVDARFKFDLDQYGKLTADLTETHTFNYKEAFGAGQQAVQLAGTHGPSSISGDTGNPRDRAQFVLTYDRGPFEITGTVNWTSQFSVIDPSESPLTTCVGAINHSFNGPAFPGTVPSEYCTINSFTTLDLYASYALTKQWSIHGSVLNVFNKQAPVDYETYGGGGGAFYDAALEQAGAVGRFFSIGATLKF
jgi:iron complex outermembrane receptor protein